MAANGTSIEFRLSQEPLPVPSIEDIGPVPFLSGDNESFVVIMNAADLDDNEIADVSLIRDHKQLLQEELAQLESAENYPQPSLLNNEEIKQNGAVSADGDQGTMNESVILPALPQPQMNGIDNITENDKMISIVSFPPSDFASEEIQIKVNQLVEENIQLKHTIEQNNESMRKQCANIAAYQEAVTKVHEEHKQKFADAKKYIEALKLENATYKQDLDNLRATLNRQRSEHDETKRLLTETSETNLKEFELDVAAGKIKELEGALQRITLKSEGDVMEKAALVEKLERYENELESAYKKIRELERRQDIDDEEAINKHKLAEEKLLLSEMANERLNEEILSLRNQLARNVQTADDVTKFQATFSQITSERDQLAAEVNSKNATIIDVQSLSLKLKESLQEANEQLVQHQLMVQDLREKEEQARIEAWRNKQKLIELEKVEVARPVYTPEVNPGELAYLRNQLMESQKALTEAHQARAVAEATAQTLRNETAQLRADLERKQEPSDDEFALRTQLDVYKTDYDAERNAKEEILREKNRVAEDMQHLHRRNQQMQEEIEILRTRLARLGVNVPPSMETVEQSGSQQQSSSASRDDYIYKCPKCSFGFKTLTAVENHVMRCIELDDDLP